MLKNWPLLISALIGASVASLITWELSSNQVVEQRPHMIQSKLTTQGFSQAIEKVAPAVVNFYTRESTSLDVDSTRSNILDNLPGSSGLKSNQKNLEASSQIPVSLGSGVILDSSGHLITNNHVIQGAGSIRAILSDGRDLPAQVLGHDPDTDLAVLKIEGDHFPSVTIAAENQTKTGDIVLAIGYPYGIGQAVSMGIVSATDRSGLNLSTFEDFIQTDAAINRGSSGGALINTQGEVVGISTAILTESGGSQGIGFAIPAHFAITVMQALLEDGRVKRGWLGILPEAIDPETANALNLPPNTGIQVKAVPPHTPAQMAGLEIGDIILMVDEEVVRNQHEALNAIASKPPGSQVDIHILRDGVAMILQVEVAERPRTGN